MMRSTRPLLLAAVIIATGMSLGADARRPQSAGGSAPAATDVGQISWSCPMHPEIVENQKGTCPICKMDLVAVRLESIFSCPVHSVVAEQKAGKCPICRRDLVPTTVAVSWTCPDRPDEDYLEPGACPGGAARVVKYTVRAHGNHNPQHAGLFFMAGDNWHHLEGTYPEEGLFRLYLYDDYSRPLPLDKVAQTSGRLVTKETFDPAARSARELEAFPLQAVAGAHYLEARVGAVAIPAQLIAKVKFDAGGPEYRFDFVFPALTKETTLDMAALVAAGIDASQVPVEVPDKAEEVLAQLKVRDQQIRAIIERGAFGDLYIPALQAKDLALALDVHARALPQGERARVAAVTKEIVRAAWRLDAFGDQGDRVQIDAVYRVFSKAVAELDPIFRGARLQR